MAKGTNKYRQNVNGTYNVNNMPNVSGVTNMHNINNVVNDVSKQANVVVSEYVKQDTINGTESATDKALAALLGKTASMQAPINTTFEQNEDESVSEFDLSVNIPENFVNVTDTHKGTDEKIKDTDTGLSKQLSDLGLLNTVEMLANARNLSPAAVEQAAIAIHMLVHSITKDQATVVNKYYNEGINLMGYVSNKFNAAQMFFIGKELQAGHDVTTICKTPAYTVSQMLEIQESVVRELPTDYITAEFSTSVMCALRKAVETGIDITDIVPQAASMSALQVSLLAELKYFDVDIKPIISDKAQCSEETLFDMLKEYYTKRDNLNLVLSETGENLVKN